MLIKCFIRFVVILMFFLFNSSFAYVYSSAEEKSFIEVYEKILPSIVSIEADLDRGVSGGTGCVVSEQGIILTSSHVVEKARNIQVTTNSGREYRANVIAILRNNSDLALIKIDTHEQLPLIKFADSNDIKVGQRVLAIGCPFGFKNTLTTGIISRIDYERNKIQTDASINPGCSGGPLLNLRGEIVGINQSIYNPDRNRSNIGIGFALPSNHVLDFLRSANKKLSLGVNY